jgi:HAD superfamily hydrolase (TIGR01509 family)
MLKEPVEAALFDMDGLLFDTERLYMEATQQAAQAMGREMSLAFCHSMVGVPAIECNAMIQELYGEGFSIDELRGHYSPIMRGKLAEGIPVKPGAVELLDFLKGRGVPAALATSAHRPVADRPLEQAGLRGHFAAIATRDDVTHPKPAPDIYLEAARRLGVRPERCVAFEDSSIGLTAAHAAGTMAFMVPDILQPATDIRAKCVDVLPDLHAALAILRPRLS